MLPSLNSFHLWITEFWLIEIHIESDQILNRTESYLKQTELQNWSATEGSQTHWVKKCNLVLNNYNSA